MGYAILIPSNALFMPLLTGLLPGSLIFLYSLTINVLMKYEQEKRGGVLRLHIITQLYSIRFFYSRSFYILRRPETVFIRLPWRTCSPDIAQLYY